MANSDCILFMGSNMAEAHPVGFRWPMKGKEKGATLIHVDPRFTRMSAVCDVYVGVRSGSDIAEQRHPTVGWCCSFAESERESRDLPIAARILSANANRVEILDGAIGRRWRA